MIFKKAQLIACVLSLAGVFAVTASVYSFGSSNGAKKVQTKWDADKKKREAAIMQLTKVYQDKEADHAAKTRNAEKQLELANEKFAKDRRAAELVFADRLRKSETRASVYQRQAEAGPLQCQSLAEHAGRLDRSLEEGRAVVQELRAALGQCAKHAGTLSTQIATDRNLYE